VAISGQSQLKIEFSAKVRSPARRRPRRTAGDRRIETGRAGRRTDVL